MRHQMVSVMMDDEEKAEEYRGKKKVDLRKMTLGEWFKFMEVHVQKHIVEEAEKMSELMRSKALRVDQYIAEQKQAEGKRQCELIRSFALC